MTNWDSSDEVGLPMCPATEDAKAAAAVCDHLGIPLKKAWSLCISFGNRVGSVHDRKAVASRLISRGNTGRTCLSRLSQRTKRWVPPLHATCCYFHTVNDIAGCNTESGHGLQSLHQVWRVPRVCTERAQGRQHRHRCAPKTIESLLRLMWRVRGEQGTTRQLHRAPLALS